MLCHMHGRCDVPMRGTESDVAGMISATSSMKTVRDSRTVIPAERQIDRAAPSVY